MQLYITCSKIKSRISIIQNQNHILIVFLLIITCYLYITMLLVSKQYISYTLVCNYTLHVHEYKSKIKIKIKFKIIF